jgi:bifunctional DNA primase/polymerase-like protein/DnaB helicase-like protein
MLKWIEIYLKLGWSMIPIKPNGKEPLIPWKEYQTRQSTEQELKKWIENWPDMNLGIVTGAISQLVVVDLDGVQGINYGKSRHITSSIVSQTGNGRQLFYKWTEHVDNSVKKIAPGVDIRGDGGFVVVSPSVHPNGRIYRWEKFVPTILEPFPINIIPTGVAVNVPIVKQEGWIAKALEEMKIGNIDDTLTSILGRLRRDGYTDSDAYALLEPHSTAKGAIPGHLEEKIQNIWTRYEPKLASVQSMYSDMPTGGLSIHSPADDDSFNKFESSIHKSIFDGIRTGFPTLDKYFEGGLKSERLFTVAARTGTGKTNFAIALAANLCQQGKKVLFFSTEFQYSKIWARYLATLSEPERFRGHAFYVCDSFSPRIEQVEEAIKKVMPDVFIFDHINHIGEERESIGQFMQGANFLQRKYDCQGVMVAQLNRQADWVENGKRIEPRMSMIKGSGTIEQASSRVLLLSEVRVTPEVNEIIGVLDKNDSGDRGIINFGLYKNPYIFREII